MIMLDVARTKKVEKTHMEKIFAVLEKVKNDTEFEHYYPILSASLYDISREKTTSQTRSH